MATDRDRKTWAPWAAGWTPVFVFVTVLSLARVAYLAWLSPFTLAEDEAHYWEWSRHLGWSYYSKGPGAAWVIAFSTGLFGHSEWAVRLPAVVAVAVGSIASAAAARAVFDDRRVGFVAAVLYQCVPPLGLLGLLMTIDGPFLAAWAVACATAARAARTGRPGWLVASGMALAIGFVFKYTIVLLAIGLLAAGLAGRRRVLFPLWAWAAAGAAFALGLVPVLIWNAQHEWVTIRHLLGHLGLPGGDMPATQGHGGWHYSPLWTLEYLAMLLLGGPVAILGLYAAWRHRSDPGVRVLAAASVPVLVFYLLVTLAAEAEGNWALGGFVALVPLAAGVVPAAHDRVFRPVRAGWRLSLVAGAGAVLALPLAPLLDRLPNMGRVIPAHRLTGMRQMASDADALLAALDERTGLQPFVVAAHYGRASQMAFYLEGRPTVYAAGSLTFGGRRSQYDLWPHTDLRNPETIASLRGRPALLFGGDEALWRMAFDAVEPIERLTGEPKSDLLMFVGIGFRGFEDPR